MKHILVVSQYFYPETFRINDMACEWVNRGYKVTVLTGIPNYPMGKYFDGYDKKHRTRETWNGVNIIRIPLEARGNSRNKLMNAAGMAANYFSFVRSGKKWVKSKEAENLHADLVFTFEVSPMTQAMIGVWYGQRYKVPTFLYVQDLWPENVEIVTGIKSRLVIGPIDRMVDKIYSACDEIFVTSPSFVKAVTGRKKAVPEKKVHYWPQYAEEFYRVVDKKAAGLNILTELKLDEKSTKELVDDKTFKMAFTGNIGYAQGLQILPKAAKLLKEIKNIKFVIVGDGRYKSKLLEEIKQSGVEDKFIMIDRQPPEMIPDILALCDSAYISFMDTELFTWTIPAKLQSYMACGMPIIASASGETKRIIEEADCGRCVPIGDAKALSEAVKEIANTGQNDRNQYGSNSKKYFEEHFTKKKLMDEFEPYLR